MPTPDLFDFTTDNLDDYSPALVEELLAEQPEIYLNHLRVARWLDGWKERLADDMDDDSTLKPGCLYMIGEIAAHLRQGDLVNGGALLIG